jgi:hypothetical protein
VSYVPVVVTSQLSVDTPVPFRAPPKKEANILGWILHPINILINEMSLNVH